MGLARALVGGGGACKWEGWGLQVGGVELTRASTSGMELVSHTRLHDKDTLVSQVKYFEGIGL